jgi:hypothetical protein
VPGYYPWGFGSIGIGYYDPWDPWGYGYGGGGYYGGGVPPYVPPDEPDSSMRLKVKPREASVFVDGYYAGLVDDFDGVFQRLRLMSGPHRIEIRSDGFEPLAVDALLTAGTKATYEGELRKIE